MSHAHIHVAKPAPPFKPVILVLFITGIVLLFACLYAGSIVYLSYEEAYETTTGSVLETRIVLDHVADTGRGGHIYYRVEARTRFEQSGQPQERWLVASKSSGNRELLGAALAENPKTCEVYWHPKHPENARCHLKEK